MKFEEFAERQLPALLAFATALTDQPALADDLAQEVLIRANDRWDRIGGLDRPDLYVRKMMLNEYLSWRRRSWRLIPVGDAVAARDNAPDHAADIAEHQAMLTEIGKLSRRQRAVVVLRYYEDRTDEEIGQLLGCAPSSVRANVSRALAKLRVELRTDPAEPAELQGKV